jgi:dolichol-phosphate mannosyltransferase
MVKSGSQRLAPIVPRQASLMCAGKFLVVGGLGTLVNTAILVILYHYAHLALVAASALATELAIAHNYLWNNYWTFGRRRASLGQFARFNLVSLGGQCITVATLWILVQHTGLHYVVANLVGIGLALVWNFVVNVRWTWGPRY